MKLVALALLLAMFAIYIGTGFYEERYGWLGYVRAFAEAGTVGALADWFAVTALFRHPLGVPIPHTAIIQRRKDDIGQTLSRFVEENFLVASALRPRLEEMQFADAIASWASRPENAERLTEDIATLLNRIVSAGDNRALRDTAKETLRSALSSNELTPVIGQALELLLLKDPEQTVVNGLLSMFRQQLDDNRLSLQAKFSERTPWWLPKFVDRSIYERFVEELDTILDAAESDDDEARRHLTATLSDLVESLKSDPVLIERGEALKEKLLSHPLLQRYLSRLVNDLSAHLHGALNDPGSDARRRLAAMVTGFSATLDSRPALKQEINLWCRDAVTYVVERYSDTIAGVISETVKGWDANATAERIELQVGRDLQFIRINGTLVGGCVGLILYTSWHLLT